MIFFPKTTFIYFYLVVPESSQVGELVGLDDGLLNQFVRISLVDGGEAIGEVVGIYNEEKFMWNPSIHSTISVFTSTNQDATLDSFR